MKIRMIQTRLGTEDGFIVREYKCGTEYEIVEHLAKYFLNAGFAKQLKE